jgi:mannose-1-phosphate guanylyltransferase
VTAFLEKTPDPVTDQINAGCYLLRRRVLDAIAPGVVVSVERDTFPALLAAGETVMGYLDESYWLDVGTPAAFVQANVDLVTGRAGGVPAAEGGQALLHPSARIDPAATVGGGSSIGPDAVIDAGAEVVGSVLLAGARIGADARVVASVVGEQAVVGPGCELNGVVIGDTARLGARNELRDGARVWPQVVLPDVGVRFSTDV